MLCARKGIDYGILHTCTLDSMGHRFFHECEEMDDACYKMDEMLAHFLPMWREAGYEVIVTADHGQDERGHHGGAGALQQEFAFYYFGDAVMPAEDVVLDQLALAPSILTRLGVEVPPSMQARPFMGT
jgi:bisphosphoglycerate-independent phosphoglycerate mutase (AlkP superfamily)